MWPYWRIVFKQHHPIFFYICVNACASASDYKTELVDSILHEIVFRFDVVTKECNCHLFSYSLGWSFKLERNKKNGLNISCFFLTESVSYEHDKNQSLQTRVQGKEHNENTIAGGGRDVDRQKRLLLKCH